eukprot:10137901-Alexandrium_andersonii.AAC.1
MVPSRSALRRARRAADLRRLRAGLAATGVAAAGPGMVEVAAAAAAHHASLLRLAARALDA